MLDVVTTLLWKVDREKLPCDSKLVIALIAHLFPIFDGKGKTTRILLTFPKSSC